MHALRLDSMTAAEPPNEVAAIVVVGAQRLLARQSTVLSAEYGESLLDCAANQSGDPVALCWDGRGFSVWKT